MKTYLQITRGIIDEIRIAVEKKNSNFAFEETVKNLRWNLRRGKLKLRDTGTTEADLKKLSHHFESDSKIKLQFS